MDNPLDIPNPPAEILKFIPLANRWAIIMGSLDIINGRGDVFRKNVARWDARNNTGSISESILTLLNISNGWDIDIGSISVGNNHLTYSIFKLHFWKKNELRYFTLGDELAASSPATNAKIVGWNNEELSQLEQSEDWVSAAIINGSTERMMTSSKKIIQAYTAMLHWSMSEKQGKPYILMYDPYISRQSEFFYNIYNNRDTDWVPLEIEDYCLAKAFDFGDYKSLETQFPFICNRNYNNYKSQMERELSNLESGKTITSSDHKVVQAIAMKAAIDKKNIKLSEPNCVDESWPYFWRFLDFIKS